MERKEKGLVDVDKSGGMVGGVGGMRRLIGNGKIQ